MEFVEIERLGIRDVPKAITIADQCNLSPWSHRDFVDEICRTDSMMLKARTPESTCSGFIIARRVPGSAGGTDAEIYNIGVMPELHRRMLGSRLLNAVIEDCKRARVVNVWLEVRSSNAGAIAFYEHFGFKKIGTRKAFYRDPDEDGVTMRLTLEPPESRVSEI